MSAAAVSPWSNLTVDLLRLILKRLSIADNIRFGGVCTAWYLAASQNPHPPAPQPPYLLLPGRGDHTATSTTTTDYYLFFDLTLRREYKIHLPQLCGLPSVGSSNGRLIHIDSHAHVHTFDPITRSQIHFPSIATFPDVTALYSVRYLIDNYLTKVINCPETCTVAAICAHLQRLAFARPGDASWTPIDTMNINRFVDIVFFNEVLYAVNYHGKVISCDLRSSSGGLRCQLLGLEIDSPAAADSYMKKYLVEASGELLQVWRKVALVPLDGADECDSTKSINTTASFKVLRMNRSENRWDEVKSIGQHALFLGHNSSFSLSACEFPELKANSIYFTDDYKEYYMAYPYRKRDLGVYSLEDGSVEAFYPRDCQLNWPAPIWFTPVGPPNRRIEM